MNARANYRRARANAVLPCYRWPEPDAFGVAPLETAVFETPALLRASTRAALCLLALASTGCAVKVYQPVAGYRPVALDPQHPNFADTHLTLRCPRGELLSEFEAGALCAKVGRLFENQGAEVEVETGAARFEESLLAAPPPEEAEAPTRTELTLELRARETDESKHPLSWILFAVSFSVLPGVLESSFAQEVILRDRSGFLLVSETFEGRMIAKYGFGAWFGNTMLDLGRKKVNKLGKDVASRDLTTDLYGQLSQHVFNAKMHAQVLAQGAPAGRTD